MTGTCMVPVPVPVHVHVQVQEQVHINVPVHGLLPTLRLKDGTIDINIGVAIT